MLVELQHLKGNSFRDFKVDPLDEDRVQILKESITQDGFWGGVVIRRNCAGYEILAGQHRVEAAKAAGITKANLHMDEYDDHAAVRIYARENATQRGNAGTALMGSVAAAIALLTKTILNNGDHVSLSIPKILTILEGVPNLPEKVVRHQLMNLRVSGHYTRIVQGIARAVELENQNAADLVSVLTCDYEKAKADLNLNSNKHTKARAISAKTQLEKAKKSRAYRAFKNAQIAFQEAATYSERTFDYEGVAKHLKIPSHVDAFCELAIPEEILTFLPVDKQSTFAKHLVELAASRETELSIRFIRENFTHEVAQAKHGQRKISNQEKAELMKRSFLQKVYEEQRIFARNVRGIVGAVQRLSDAIKERPSGVTLHTINEFRSATESLEKTMAVLKKAGLM